MARPSYKPTSEQRKLVRSLAALGLRQQQICEMVDLRSPKTLRKHYAEELKAGHAEAMARLKSVAHDMAASGKYPAMTMFWQKVWSGWGRPLPVETMDDDSTAKGGAELLFAEPEPKTGAELEDFELVGRRNGQYLYGVVGHVPAIPEEATHDAD